MKIAIIGIGYWGPNLVRNFLDNQRVETVICYDIDPSRIRYIQKQFPLVKVGHNYDEILNDPTIDAIVLATPVASHFSLAKSALEHNKHILVEKPFTSSVSDAKALIELAHRNGLKLMVDHIFTYHGAIKKMKEIIDSGEIGEIMYFDAVRINLGLFQHDVNVLWDLAIHDLSIMDYVMKEKPRAVSSIGVGHFNKLEDISYLTLFFNNNCIAHIHVNWLAPVKLRRILIGGAQKMIVFDDMETVEKIKVFDKGVDVTTKEGIYKTLIQYRTGNMYSPQFDTTEPLASVTNEFINAVKQGTEPAVNGEAGLRMVKVLEAAQESIKNNGAIIELNER